MNQKLLDKYLFLFGSGGLLYILIELIWRGYSHWTMFALGGICFVFLGLINEILPWQMPVMDAGCDRRDWNHDTGVPDRMCCQPVARLGSMGLQQSSGEYFGADLSAVYDTVAAGQPGRYCPG